MGVAADEKGVAYAVFECSRLRKLRAKMPKTRQADDLYDRSKATLV